MNEIIEWSSNVILSKGPRSRVVRTEWTTKKAKYELHIQRIAEAHVFRVRGPSFFNYIFFEQDQARDPGNFSSAAQKLIEDALQKAKDKKQCPLLADDGWLWNRGHSHYWRLEESFTGTALVLTKERVLTRDEAADWASHFLARKRQVVHEEVE